MPIYSVNYTCFENYKTRLFEPKTQIRHLFCDCFYVKSFKNYIIKTSLIILNFTFNLVTSAIYVRLLRTIPELGRELFLPLELGEDRPEGADPVLQVGRHLRLERGVGGQVLLVSLGEPEQISIS